MVMEEFGVRLLGWENIREAALMGLETSLNHLRMETQLVILRTWTCFPVQTPQVG